MWLCILYSVGSKKRLKRMFWGAHTTHMLTRTHLEKEVHTGLPISRRPMQCCVIAGKTKKPRTPWPDLHWLELLLCVLVYVDLRKKKYSSAWLLLLPQHIVCCVIVCVGSWALSLSSFSPVSLSSFSLSLSILDTRGVGRGLQSFLINAWLWFQGGWGIDLTCPIA